MWTKRMNRISLPLTVDWAIISTKDKRKLGPVNSGAAAAVLSLHWPHISSYSFFFLVKRPVEGMDSMRSALTLSGPLHFFLFCICGATNECVSAWAHISSCPLSTQFLIHGSRSKFLSFFIFVWDSGSIRIEIVRSTMLWQDRRSALTT